MHFLHLADRAVLQDAHGSEERCRRVHVNAHLRHPLLLVGDLHHAAHFVDVVGHGLLAVNVDAQFHRARPDGSVHVVRGGDVGGVQVLPFLVEQNAPVLIDLRLGKELHSLGRPIEVNIANRDEFHVRAFAN